ncbi:MAG: PQQ-like beta-propeller repeat protein [Planctomycetes bacterium]|nr:PQQ-like beta-propeller repeat protein [Planctomycetota bacterium]
MLWNGKRVWAAAVVLLAATAGCASDKWLQWGGSGRDFSSAGTINWSGDGPREIWRRDLGEGYSGILAEGDRLFTMMRRGENEVVVALDAGTGKTIWEYTYPAPLPKDADQSFGKGPNSTPLIDGDRLVTVGYNGLVHCLHKKDGRVIWTVDLFKKFKGSPLPFGYSASPLSYGGNVILPVGGDGQAVVALKMADGSVAWKGQSFTNTYSTPLLIDVGGQTQLVMVMSAEVVGMDPSNGSLLWSFPMKNRWDMHVFVPVWGADNLLFVSSFEQCHVLRLTRTGEKTTVETVVSPSKVGISHTNAVRIGDTIYGSSGSQRASFVTAVNIKTGEVLWKERGFGVANYLRVGDRLLLLDGNGQVALAAPTEKALNVLGKMDVLAKRAWTAPTLIGKRLYLRDQKHILAMQLQ